MIEATLTTDESESAKAELNRIIDEALHGREPSSESSVRYIHDAVSEEVLHQYDSEIVLEAAHERGFWVVACYMCDNSHGKYKANGVWVEPKSVELRESLSSVRSHGLCPEHEAECRKSWGLQPPKDQGYD